MVAVDRNWELQSPNPEKVQNLKKTTPRYQKTGYAFEVNFVYKLSAVYYNRKELVDPYDCIYNKLPFCFPE